MRKIFIITCTFLLSLAVGNAQRIIKIPLNTDRSVILKNGSHASISRSVEFPKRIALDGDETIVGFYTGDEIGADTAYGFPEDTYDGVNWMALVEFKSDMLAKYEGGTFTKARFAVNQPWGSSKVYLFKLGEDGILNPIDSSAVESVVKGWNDINFPNSKIVEKGQDYFIGFTIKQKKGENGIIFDNAVNPDPDGGSAGGAWIYGPFGANGTLAMTDMSQFFGNILIQAVIKHAKIPQYDLSLEGLKADGYAKSGKDINFKFGAGSRGMVDPTDYSFKAEIDGKAINANFTKPDKMTSKESTVTGTITLPVDESAGKHTLTVTVDKIEGEVPTEKINDDVVTTTFIAYGEEVVPRQKQLVENFTSQHCVNCPYGDNILEKLDDKRDDVAWISIHENFNGKADVFAIDDVENLWIFSNPNLSLPLGSFNRMFIDNNELNQSKALALELGYGAEHVNYYASTISDIIDEQNVALPGFVSLNLNTTYDEATRQLTVNVNGKGVKDFDKIIGDDAVVTVCLTEDGLVAPQFSLGKYVNNYTHNHVLRARLTGEFGDAIVWTGNTFDKVYTTTLDQSWKPENMSVIAFVSRPIVFNAETNEFTTTPYDACVFNTEMVKLSQSTEVRGIMTSSNVKEVNRYTIDGRKVCAPVNGVNIVKLSDGRTVKMIVRK